MYIICQQNAIPYSGKLDKLEKMRNKREGGEGRRDWDITMDEVLSPAGSTGGGTCSSRQDYLDIRRFCRNQPRTMLAPERNG